MAPNETRGVRWVRPIALLLSTAVSLPLARAAIDATGDWYLSAEGRKTALSLMQTGGTLHAFAGWPVNAGTIDSATGAFTLLLAGIIEPGSCGVWLRGTVSQDGRTLEGTTATIGPPPGCQSIGCYCSSSSPAVPLYGSRAPCGDGQLDPGESCDDGSLAPGDCCALACTPERAGSACADDGDVCTDETCDGSGACLHSPNTASCDSTCAPGGVCADGACVSPVPAPAGIACDRDANACSADACDGAGRCVAQRPLDCGPCGFCQPPGGCRAQVRPNCAVAGRRAHLDLRKGATAAHDRVLFTWSDPDPGDGAASFGNPTTTTDFALCLHQPTLDPDLPAIPVGELAVAGGDLCDGRPCWTAVRDGFRRSDSAARTVGGAPRVSLRAAADGGTRLVVRGAGVALDLPESLDVPGLRVQLVARDHATGDDMVCWEATFAEPTRRNARRFAARR